MRTHILFGLVLSVFPVSLAFAFPIPEDVCIFPKKADGKPDRTLPGLVSKELMATAFLKQNPGSKDLFIDTVGGQPSKREYGPAWRRIFVDPAFCQGKNERGCIGPHIPPTDPSPPDDNTAALDNVEHLRTAFLVQLLREGNSRFYKMDDAGVGTDYFLGGDTEKAMICLPSDAPTPTAPKAVKLKVPDALRLRANSDDLNVDRTNPVYTDAFKSVKPATINFSRDGVEKTNKANLQATLGYAIPLFKDPSPPWMPPGIFTGELVPYISTSQSSQKVDGMAATFTDTNNVAVGALLNTELLLKGSGLNNVILAKPQYLWNTKDKSEIASLKFIYAPWTGGLVRINTPMQLGSFFNASWLQLLFDLRSNVGEYTKKSPDPMLAMTQSSFERAGTKFGFSLATNNSGPHVVLLVTETLLYGFTGNVRHLDLFDASLAFYLDSTSNYAFTLSYTKGQNEDTAEKAQTFMAGLSAKF
jgi:hypothetical protein